MANIAFKPTDEQRKQVDAMAAYGVPEDSIAKVLGISPHTLRKYFRDELDTAHVKANSAVAQSLYRKAIGDGPQSVTAAIFWLKTRMGWKETAQAVELTGKDGGPIETSDTSAARELIERRIAGLAARGPAEGNTGKPH